MIVYLKIYKDISGLYFNKQKQRNPWGKMTHDTGQFYGLLTWRGFKTNAEPKQALHNSAHA